jgi:ferredoxin
MSRAFAAPGAASLSAPIRRVDVRACRGRAAALPVRAAMVTVTFSPAEGGAAIVSEVPKASVLREVALGEKVELYQGMNKLLNCGGNGNCGTCRVIIESGAELLSPRTDVEVKKLKGKPENNRLACQCLIGGPDAPEGAEVKVTTKPPK